MSSGELKDQHEQEYVIDPMVRDGWTYLDPCERPEWIENAVTDEIQLSVGKDTKKTLIQGGNFVYCLVSGIHGSRFHTFRQLKSDYFETTSQKGTCPNCQAYIKRYSGDVYLTCHRCQWQYNPLRERLRALVSKLIGFLNN